MMRPGLAFKLSCLLALIGILASGLTGYYTWSDNQTLLLDEAGRNLQTSTELLSHRLALALSEVEDDAVMLASLPASRAVAAAPVLADAAAQRQAAEAFGAMLKVHPDFLQVRLITRHDFGLERIRFDREDDRILQVDEAHLQEKGHLPYVFETLALKPGQVYLSPITVNHESGAHSATGRPTLRLSTPVADASGEAVGVVVINVDLPRLVAVLEADLPEGHELYLANAWGDFLVHPDPAMTFGFDHGRRILIQDSFASTRDLLVGARATVLINGVTHPGEAGNRILAFARKPFGPKESGQFVIVGLARPLGDVLGGGVRLGHRVLNLVLGFSLLSILLAAVFARAMIHPLKMLTQAAIGFSSRRSFEALPLQRSDEIGVLARCFAQMRDEISAHLDLLYHKQKELVDLARLDGLTGLANRMEFFQVLETAIADARAREELVAVLFIDLDHFKEFNDRHGHGAGDALLKAVAERLRASIRHNDLVARLGGDEFTVLIRGPRDGETVATIAEKILASVDAPVQIGPVSVRISASVGISLYPRDGANAEELMARADAAMYRSKAAGRHTSRFYERTDDST